MHLHARRVALLATTCLGVVGCVVNTTPNTGASNTQSTQTGKIFYASTKGAATGAKQKIDTVYSIRPDCTSVGYATIRIATPPTHGKLTSEPGEDFPYFKQDNVRSACNTKKVPVIT